jgi:hypothetical protein
VNVWECADVHCSRKCYGTGGAIGLRAIGWWFETGGAILCPQHRPAEGTKCRETTQSGPCQLCAAEIEAEKWQSLIRTERAAGR